MAYATNTFNVSYNGTTVHVDELDFRLLLLFRIISLPKEVTKYAMQLETVYGDSYDDVNAHILTTQTVQKLRLSGNVKFESVRTIPSRGFLRHDVDGLIVLVNETTGDTWVCTTKKYFKFPKVCKGLFGNLNITSLDISNFSTTGVENFDYMFLGSKIGSVKMGVLDLRKAHDNHKMFHECQIGKVTTGNVYCRAGSDWVQIIMAKKYVPIIEAGDVNAEKILSSGAVSGITNYVGNYLEKNTNDSKQDVKESKSFMKKLLGALT